MILFLISAVNYFFLLLMGAVLALVILSWFSREPTKLEALLGQVVNPMLRPFRWAHLGAFDFSPVLLLFVLDFLSSFISGMLIQFL
jgi:uncharacterized protein YggT (Ycf19 family)